MIPGVCVFLDGHAVVVCYLLLLRDDGGAETCRHHRMVVLYWGRGEAAGPSMVEVACSSLRFAHAMMHADDADAMRPPAARQPKEGSGRQIFIS